MRDDGSRIKRLDPRLEGAALSPADSPNGKRIVFKHNPPHGDPRIAVMRVDGSRARDLTGGYDSSPTYSPNGKRIVFSRGTMHGEKLFVMRSDGTHEHSVTKGEVPDWSVRP